MKPNRTFGHSVLFSLLLIGAAGCSTTDHTDELTTVSQEFGKIGSPASHLYSGGRSPRRRAGKQMSLSVDLLSTYHSYVFDEGAAEIVAYDKKNARAYLTNADANSVVELDLSNPEDPTKVAEYDMSPYGGGVNSVDVHKGLVAVAVEAEEATDRGNVVLLRKGRVVKVVPAGALPDSLAFSPNGKMLAVANEGEPNDDYTIDPEGSVTLINLRRGPRFASTHEIDFSHLAPHRLEPSVRVFGPGASVAQDLEPEYVAFAPDGRILYASLQENNALAVIDTWTKRVIRVMGLGFKDHSLPENKLDASNRDDEVSLQNWPVFGMYQPDTIASFEVDGETFVITANEGDARDYDGYSEEERVKDFDLDPVAFPNADSLQQDERLGRLRVTSANGDTDGDGDYDRLFSYGARSFSIISRTDGRMVFDSGDEFERILAQRLPEDFNSNNDENDSFDARSDDKGPEPEAVAVGKVDGRTYGFIGLERVGGVMVYDLSNPRKPEFVEYFNTRNFGIDFDDDELTPETFEQVGDLGPESIVFVPEKDNATDSPLLLVANEVSGSLSVFSLNFRKEDKAHQRIGEGPRAFEIASLGDMPYYNDGSERPQPIINHERWGAVKESINSAYPAFTVFVGDTKTGSGECTDSYNLAILDEFNSFELPLIYTPGDNEWTDCHRISTQRGFDDSPFADPLDRLEHLRSLYSGRHSLGENRMRLRVQSRKFPENTMWKKNDVVFAAVHVVGSNNNAPTPIGLDDNDEIVYAGDQAEYSARERAGIKWMERAFARAQRSRAKGVGLFIHANPNFYDLSPTRSRSYENSAGETVEVEYENGFYKTLLRMQELSAEFEKPVFVVYGDSHYYRQHRPYDANSYYAAEGGLSLPNFTAVEVPGSSDEHWVHITVDPDHPEVFAFREELVEEGEHLRHYQPTGPTGLSPAVVSGEAFEVGLIGDLPYGQPADTWAQLQADVDHSHVAFSVHVGDFKSGGTVCSDEAFASILTDFESSLKPLFYTPGDNEWTDCHRESNGSYDPLERLAQVRQMFTAGARSFGLNRWPLKRQSEDFAENISWAYGGVQFAAVHVVGSNNNAERTNGTGDDDEFMARDAANREWLSEVFASAKEDAAAGLMLIIHANPGSSVTGNNWRFNDIDSAYLLDDNGELLLKDDETPYINGFAPWMQLLRQEVLDYGRPVVLVHGDSHFYRIDKPMRATTESGQRTIEHFTRLEVPGDQIVDWVRVTVDPNDPAVFRFDYQNVN